MRHSANPQVHQRTRLRDHFARARVLTSSIMMMLPLILSIFGTEPAQAMVYSCPTSDGDVQFQDRPCATVESTERTQSPARERNNSVNGRPLPAGIHKSWFERPPGVSRRAYCDETGCECGLSERSFDGGLTFAVADALYLDGAWHRYHNSIGNLLDASRDGDAAKVVEFTAAVEDAACEVLMSQQTLMKFADPELRRLRRRAQSAEDLGRDDETACDGFSDAACADYEQLLMYRSMSLDARALAQPRRTTAENDYD